MYYKHNVKIMKRSTCHQQEVDVADGGTREKCRWLAAATPSRVIVWFLNIFFMDYLEHYLHICILLCEKSS